MLVLILAIPMAILETLSVVNQNLNEFLSDTALVGKKSSAENEDKIELSSQTRAIAWMISYVFLFFIVGPLLAMVIAPLVVMLYIGKLKLWVSITVMTSTWLIVYFVFVILIEAKLPPGFIFGGIY